MKTFYFSATGNCLDIAKRIGGELISIPQVIKRPASSFEDDKIGIVFPCYYFGTPRIVQEFLKKVSLKSKYIFAIMTYGNYSAGAVNYFERQASKQGIKLSYLNEILMVDNYLPFFDMEKQQALEPEKNIGTIAAGIAEDIKASRQFILKKNIIKKILSASGQMFYRTTWYKADKNFSVNNNCDRCKICEQVCPVKNIIVKEKPQYQHKCDECFACIHLCPLNAIHHKRQRNCARYRNKNVTLKEIIFSNQ